MTTGSSAAHHSAHPLQQLTCGSHCRHGGESGTAAEPAGRKEEGKTRATSTKPWTSTQHALGHFFLLMYSASLALSSLLSVVFVRTLHLLFLPPSSPSSLSPTWNRAPLKYSACGVSSGSSSSWSRPTPHSSSSCPSACSSSTALRAAVMADEPSRGRSSRRKERREGSWANSGPV